MYSEDSSSRYNVYLLPFFSKFDTFALIIAIKHGKSKLQPNNSICVVASNSKKLSA